MYPFPLTSYFTSLCFLFPHLILLSAIVCLLLSPQLCFLSNFYCFCLLSLIPPPLLLSLRFLLQHPLPSEFICSAEFHHVRIQLWHKAACDLVTSNLSLNHNETLSQTKLHHHMRGISCMETIFWMRRAFLMWQLPLPHFCKAKNVIYFNIKECQIGPSGKGRSSANYW